MVHCDARVAIVTPRGVGQFSDDGRPTLILKGRAWHRRQMDLFSRPPHLSDRHRHLLWCRWIAARLMAIVVFYRRTDLGGSLPTLRAQVTWSWTQRSTWIIKPHHPSLARGPLPLHRVSPLDVTGRRPASHSDPSSSARFP